MWNKILIKTSTFLVVVVRVQSVLHRISNFLLNSTRKHNHVWEGWYYRTGELAW